MAIESLNLAIRAFGTPLYVYHEIVHNRWVVEHFRQAGVVFVDSLDRVPEEQHIYSIPPVACRPPSAGKRWSGKLRAIDATCPLVTKVHAEAIRVRRGRGTLSF